MIVWLSKGMGPLSLQIKHKQDCRVKRVWKYQCGNQNPLIEEKQTRQWPKEKGKKKDKQRSTKHTHKTKDRVTRTQLKTGDELFLVNVHFWSVLWIFFRICSKNANVSSLNNSSTKVWVITTRGRRTTNSWSSTWKYKRIETIYI